MKCLICNMDVNLDTANFVVLHIKKIHGITSQEYYDKYINKGNEGICLHCQKPTKFNGLISGYATYCSKACTSRSAISKSKGKETTLRKYGVEHISQTEKFRNNLIKSNKENKSILTEGLQKSWKVNKESILTKRYNTNIEKYGVSHPAQNTDILHKIETTNINRYGVKSTLSSIETQNKIIETNLHKYNVKYACASTQAKEKIQKTRRGNYWNSLISQISTKNITPNMTLDEFKHGSNKFSCLICKRTFDTDVSNAYDIRCPWCVNHRSQYENDIMIYLNSMDITNVIPNKKFSENGKRNYEIDLFLPDYNIGIEYCGLYWHSTFFKSKKYHQDKYIYFRDKGIKLIQIYESEWKNKNPIVKSILNNALKCTSTKLYARKCTVVELNSKTYTSFLQDNHLQGNVPTEYKYGLMYNNELMAVCGIGKSRYNKNISHELIRFCIKANTSITGAFSKLTKHIIHKHSINELISYSDLRYFDSHAYEAFGFKYKGNSPPNYYYFKNNSSKLESRIKYQKHKLHNLLPIFDPTKTEMQNMIDNKYFCIYDAGNSIWVYNKSIN